MQAKSLPGLFSQIQVKFVLILNPFATHTAFCGYLYISPAGILFFEDHLSAFGKGRDYFYAANAGFRYFFWPEQCIHSLQHKKLYKTL